MGVVYKAQDTRLKRQVAIKLLPPDLTRDETAKQRFLQEAQAASALNHPNICTIYEINEAPDGQLYLVMAHYAGETLKERIARWPLALDDAIEIATQVGHRLAEAHGAGIVHRDIKLANLFVAKQHAHLCRGAFDDGWCIQLDERYASVFSNSASRRLHARSACASW